MPFDDSAIAELAKIIGMSDSDAIEDLRRDLVEIASHYRAIIAVLPCDLPDAPFNMSLTKRAEWLDINMVKPCERLLDALSDEQRPMFSTWPYPLTIPEFRDNTALKAELNAVLEFSRDLRASLQQQQSDDAGHNQELRAEIFASCARTLRRHRPELKPNRGVYDAKFRRRVGAYVEAIGLIYSEIAGQSDNLDRLIRGEMKHPF